MSLRVPVLHLSSTFSVLKHFTYTCGAQRERLGIQVEMDDTHLFWYCLSACGVE